MPNKSSHYYEVQRRSPEDGQWYCATQSAAGSDAEARDFFDGLPADGEILRLVWLGDPETVLKQREER